MDLLTAAQAAALLDVDDSTVRHLIRDGRLPAIKPGHDWLIEREDVENYSARRRKRDRPPRTGDMTMMTQPNGLIFMPTYKNICAAWGIPREQTCIMRNDADGAFYDRWLDSQDEFELAIGLQRRKEYEGMKWMVVLVVDHAGQEVCAGLYHIEGWVPTKPGTIDPILKVDVSATHPYHYRVRLSRYMAFLVGHPISVEWGPSPLAFCQKQDKRIVLIPGPKVPFKMPLVLGGE